MMRVRDLARYCRDLGWRDAPNPPESTVMVPSDSPSQSNDLGALSAMLEGCVRCRLSERRRNIVFGEGAERAAVLFIGEGPGAEEDRTGRPFVGQAGRLLDGMIFSLGFERNEVYIGNVVKCRPPDNRDPQEDEMAACSSFLERQIELIRPQVIVTLGRVAARHLTGSTKPMGALRGRWTSYKGVPMLPMFHPAYLLRNPKAKRETWQDVKAVTTRLSDSDSEI